MSLARLKAKREAKARACPVSKMDWPEVLDLSAEKSIDSEIAWAQGQS
jgi:hypothetical protein